MTKVLFTGATGLLGRYFLLKTPSKFQVIGTYHKNPNFKHNNFLKLDVVNKKEVISLFERINPDIVVHAASIGSVDYCELHEKEANEVNVKGTINVVEACRLAGAKLIFISSNAVYDGENPPYSEDSPRKPLDEYGRTKVKGENIVSTSGLPYNIVRLMTMYGWPPPEGRGNPVSWMIDEILNKRKINVVDDIYNNHLYAGSASEALWNIIERGKQNEAYNVSGKDCITRFELAKKVADVFNLNSSLINPVKSDFFKNIAPRPKNSCFNTAKLEDKLGFAALSVDQGLKEMLHEK